MNRRKVLKYAAMVTGTAICAPLTSALLMGCSEQSVTDTAKPIPLTASQVPEFFDRETFEAITQIMDTILPKTDSPSASEVKVHLIMDNMFHKVFDEKYRQRFLKQFAHLNDYLASNNFYHAGPQAQLKQLHRLEAMTSEPENPVYRAYIDLKQQTISYYLSTEEIGENYLNYLPIPGGYTPCVTVAEVGGKAWAE
ncbi:gluconate 2-dehydrogenase subunit 3 family protein [Thalassotalea litorea]|uniref:gluconate 2-dehydrogenase subunit 3 family protein n=1 Tax=Thalassotalea litorea TaxID=2020715 RepID=UPI00373700A1